MEKEKRDYVSIAFCCNDPDNGDFMGKFCTVHIGDDILNLENKYYPPRYTTLQFDLKSVSNNGFAPGYAKGRVKISRRWFPIVGYKYGWGNWCWDLVVVHYETAAQIIDYLKTFECFSVDSGDWDFTEQFEADEPIKWTPENVELLQTAGWQRP